MTRTAMLRSFAVLLFLALSTVAAAQPSGIFLTGGMTRASFDAERLAELTDTHNAYYSAVLSEPVQLLPTESTRPAFGLAGRINLGGIAAAFSYQISRNEYEALSAYANGRTSRLTTRTLDHVATVEMTTSALKPLVLGATGGGMFRGVRIESATIYQDGSESLGTEFQFNGVYTASSPYFEAGLVAGLTLGDRLFIPVRIFFPIEISEFRLPVLDFEVRNTRDYFPRDWDRYLEDTNGTNDDNALSDRDFVGPRVQVGVEIRIL